MARTSKNYRLQLPPSALADYVAELTVRFKDEHGQLGREFDFRQFQKCGDIAQHLALSFARYGADQTPASRATTFGAVLAWFRFLEEDLPTLASVVEVDGEVIRAFIAWLNRRGGSKTTRHASYGLIKRLLSWLQRNRPHLVNPRLEFPYNPYPRPQSDSLPREALSRSEMERVLSAARSELERNWERYQGVQAALRSVDRVALSRETDLEKLPLEQLGVVLAVVLDRFDGLVPTKLELAAAGLHRFYKALVAHGGIESIVSHLHATSDLLTPYLLIIGASLYANSMSLTTMRRDCVLDHVLLDGRAVVCWTKGRARRVQRRSFLRDRKLSVPRLIEQVLQLTEPLVRHASPQHRDYLFLCSTRRGGARIAPYPHESSTCLENFVARHDLRRDDGSPLPLVLGTLRRTGLELAHEALGRDVLKTQLLANHVSPGRVEAHASRAAATRDRESRPLAPRAGRGSSARSAIPARLIPRREQPRTKSRMRDRSQRCSTGPN
jgi:hypothetical protein